MWRATADVCVCVCMRVCVCGGVWCDGVRYFAKLRNDMEVLDEPVCESEFDSSFEAAYPLNNEMPKAKMQAFFLEAVRQMVARVQGEWLAQFHRDAQTLLGFLRGGASTGERVLGVSDTDRS